MTNDNPRSEDPDAIIEEDLEGIEDKNIVHVDVNRRNAIAQALKDQSGDDVVVILGKGDETYQIIYDKKFPFDDRNSEEIWNLLRGLYMSVDRIKIKNYCSKDKAKIFHFVKSSNRRFNLADMPTSAKEISKGDLIKFVFRNPNFKPENVYEAWRGKRTFRDYVS